MNTEREEDEAEEGRTLLNERDAMREAEPPLVSAEAGQISPSVSSQVVCLSWTLYSVFIQTPANVRPFKVLTRPAAYNDIKVGRRFIDAGV